MTEVMQVREWIVAAPGRRALEREYRCRKCGRLLCCATLPSGAHVRIRCPKCGREVVLGETGQAVSEADLENGLDCPPDAC